MPSAQLAARKEPHVAADGGERRARRRAPPSGRRGARGASGRRRPCARRARRGSARAPRPARRRGPGAAARSRGSAGRPSAWRRAMGEARVVASRRRRSRTPNPRKVWRAMLRRQASSVAAASKTGSRIETRGAATGNDSSPQSLQPPSTAGHRAVECSSRWTARGSSLEEDRARPRHAAVLLHDAHVDVLAGAQVAQAALERQLELALGVERRRSRRRCGSARRARAARRRRSARRAPR